MSNVIVFTVTNPGNRSKSIDADTRLKIETMESVRDQVKDVFAKLSEIQDELTRAHLSCT